MKINAKESLTLGLKRAKGKEELHVHSGEIRTETEGRRQNSAIHGDWRTDKI